MINYENGKKLVTAGFAFSLLTLVLSIGVEFFGYIVFGGIGGFFYNVWEIINFAHRLSVFMTVAGYAIAWLSNREMLDLAAGALLALNAFSDLFLVGILGFHYVISGLISCILTVGLYFVLAIRVKDKNRMLFLLLGCGVLFEIVMTLYNMFIPGLLPFVLVSLVAAAGNVVCAGLCFLASKQD